MPHSKTKVIFVNSHPTQYFSPFYSLLSQHPSFELEVYFCSDENVGEYHDLQFNRKVSWDVPLLDGYVYRFFRIYSLTPGIFKGFFGLINPGLWLALLRSRKSLVIVHGWNYFTTFVSIILASLAGHTVCLRGETPLNQESSGGIKFWLTRHLLLKRILFPFVNRFLYIGRQNREFYLSLGVSDQKLVHMPYCVDNDRLSKSYDELRTKKDELRDALGLKQDEYVILYCGKYTEKKRPLDLVKAFHRANFSNAHLLMVGEGELRRQLESFIESNNVDGVSLVGFVNQTELPKYYMVADVFVLPSDVGETWGLVVNEAMNFGLPVVVSDTPGSAYDLVVPNKNGFCYETGAVDQLVDCLRQLDSEDLRRSLGSGSLELIKTHSFGAMIEALEEIRMV